jgi:hypothetical protein
MRASVFVRSSGCRWGDDFYIWSGKSAAQRLREKRMDAALELVNTLLAWVLTILAVLAVLSPSPVHASTRTF